ncbi:MAG TPA: sodium:solute symporter [Cyclobacteriaceae bacterium]|nr:sodium:solute symporter [Cyclobacteriaceae bacterium]
MSPTLLFSVIIGYFVLLMAVAWATSKGANNESFFIGNRNSSWMLVAFGMIGTTLSGVTFVSVPGAVGQQGFIYAQIILGNFIGFILIAYLLLPLYYKLNLTSIYTYLQVRLGFISYKTGASFFILSRTLGATARLFLVVRILHDGILQNFGLPFWVTTLIILGMILIYTFEGGVKTIVWTDTLQTSFIVGGLLITIGYLLNSLDLNLFSGFQALNEKGYTRLFDYDVSSNTFVIKQILAGTLIMITMVGMDQEMMQKNISVKTLADSRKNMLTFSVIFVLGNMLSLFLGGLLYLYAGKEGITAVGDHLFPAVALNYLPPALAIVFIIALISALFPSADGAITALTSSTCIDIIGINRRSDWDEAKRLRVRKQVHLFFALLFFVFVMFFRWKDDPSMITVILKAAGYTYGPLLGLFAFGMITRRSVRDQWVIYVTVTAPLLCLLLDYYQERIFDTYRIGLELVFFNGLATFIGLWFISSPSENAPQPIVSHE